MILDALLGGLSRRASPENPNVPLSQVSSWLPSVFGYTTDTGMTITPDTALKFSAVYAAVTIIAGTVGSLPLILYERMEPRGKKRLTGTPLYRLLHDEPNPRMSSMTFRETLMAHLLLWGNAYAEIQRNRMGEVAALWPIPPWMVDPRVDRNGNVLYVVSIDGTEYGLEPKNILHVPGLGYDGVRGLSPIAYHRQGIAIALAAEKYGAKFFANDSRPGGILSSPNPLNDEDRKRLKDSWEQFQRASENAWRVAVLDKGLQWQQVGMAPKDAHFIETRVFQVREIARMFNIPLHKLKDLERETHNNIEQQEIEFVQDTIRPWCVRWEQELNRKLVPPQDRGRVFFEFLLEGLLRADAKTMAEVLAQGRQWGWLSPNDCREKLNMPLIEGGDTYHVPVNMMPLDAAADVPQQGEGEKNAAAEEKSAAEPERRSLPPYAVRLRLREAYRKALLEAAGRLVREETKALLRAAKKLLRGEKGGIEEFRKFLREYFREHPERVRRHIGGLIEHMAEDIVAAALEEVGRIDLLEDDSFLDQRTTFAGEYLDVLGVRLAEPARGQLEALLDEADDAETAYGLVEERLGEWEETRAGKIARNESVRAEGALAAMAFAAAGAGALVWTTLGKNCPMCNSLAGKRIKPGGHFHGPGDRIPDGKGGHLIIKHKVSHPPLHSGCDCIVTAVR